MHVSRKEYLTDLCKNRDRLTKWLALSNRMRDAKNSTSQTVPLGNQRALIPIKQPENCLRRGTIQ
ncbi:hypothetical protein [Nostoc sp. DedQUE09]|uniref:hypothetical protein n=1 Tax=Nostoc sp. DedQUE09 TaxID=3075394 RepID=UPI002AD518E4|nr:hypothetical protein [Nostoc sp. DedQUE09]MDZ7951353.1 hypothetical protein [Nostoc sp. DedQUE09]